MFALYNMTGVVINNFYCITIIIIYGDRCDDTAFILCVRPVNIIPSGFELQTVRVDKLPTNGSTVVVELQSPVTFTDLNALSKRDVIVTLEAKQSSFKLQGVVVPRVFCDIYQTLVVSNGHQIDSKKDRCVPVL